MTLTLQEVLEEIGENQGEERTEKESLVSELLFLELFEALPVSQKEISNLELYTVLLALTRNSNP